MEPVTTTVDDDGIATLTMDLPGRSVNVLGAELQPALAAAIEGALADPAVRGIVLTSGKPAFVAGADLKTMNTDASPVDRVMTLSRDLRRLETGGKPVVCAINGTAVGGGLEIALACHHRLVADDAGIRLGLPESKLGLLPGGGGTQRLPRLIGIQAALPLLLQGTLLTPAAALEAGIVDAVVPAGRLLAEAKRWLLEVGDPVAPWDRPGYRVPGGAGSLIEGVRNLFSISNVMTRANGYGNYPAPAAILSAVYEGTQLSVDRALRLEAKYLVKLLSGPESSALVRTMFLSKDAADKLAGRPAGMPRTTFTRIGIMGAGTMGAGLALTAAKARLEVVLLDRDLPTAEKGRDYAGKRLRRDVEKGRRTAAEADAVLARITPTDSYEELAGLPIVIEAVFEDRAVKQAVLGRARAALPADAVLASNTSAMPITGLAEYTSDPGRFVGMHFFSPAERMPLVEIIRGKQTTDETLAVALDLAKVMRKTPIVVNDAPGFFTSRFIGSFITESMRMVAAGVNPHLVENGARMAGMPMGALTVSDSIGLDLSVHAARQRALDAGNPDPDLGVVGLLVERGRHGRKNGAGFYDYAANGDAVLWPGLRDLIPPADEQPSIEEVKTRILYAQLVEGTRAFAEGVLPTVRDGDLGACLGVGFPAYLGGPFVAIDAIGLPTFVATADRLADLHGPQFAVPALIREMAADGRTFYGEGAA
jgi:3-hydroxyacyl-CoA dehydrogenase / enoyl-CoA hydratase / 3-hydroxybutyryl-CoA epimerase